MNPSKLRHRIEVYGKEKQVNELLETEYKDVSLGKVYAEIIPQTGSIQRQGSTDAILSNVTHKVIIRYNAGKNITNNMYLMYKDKRFDIKYILNPYFKNETLEIFCTEVIE